MPSVIYNAANIQAWENEVVQAQKNNERHEIEAAKERQSINDLQAQLTPLALQLNQIQSQITNLEIRNAIDRNNHMHDHHHHDHHHYGHHHHGHHHHHNHGGTLHLISDIAANLQLNSLYNQRSSIQNRLYPIERAIEQHQYSLSTALNGIADNKRRISLLEKNAQAAKGFLATLGTNPAALVAELKHSLLVSCKRWDDNNPLRPSLQTHIALYALQEKLDVISETTDAKEQYLMLTALIREMRDKVTHEGLTQGFADILNNLEDSTHIGEDLPDSFKTGKTTTHHFSMLQTTKPELFALGYDRILQLEEEQFQKLETINHAGSSALHTKIASAIRLVRAEVAEKKAQNSSFTDYHYYNRVLSDLHKVAQNPNDINTAMHLTTLAQCAAGTPKKGKQIAGALMIVAGVLLVAASLALLGVTLGGSSFASAFGVSFGLSLIAAQITLGTTATVSAAASTGLTFWGINKYKEGLRQGLSKELQDISDDMKNTAPIL